MANPHKKRMSETGLIQCQGDNFIASFRPTQRILREARIFKNTLFPALLDPDRPG